MHKLTKTLLLVLLALGLFGCAASGEQVKAEKSEQKSGTSEDKTKTYSYPLPMLFDVSLLDHPKKLEDRLMALGYQLKKWLLAAPYSRFEYALADSQATFGQVTLLVCNHPAQIASVSIQSPDPANFYKAVKERFQLGTSQWEKDDRAGPFGRYTREFAGHTKLVLDSSGQNSQLSLDVLDVQSTCQKNLADDVQELESAQVKQIETARQKQRDSF